jgi:hypothetical protein
MYRQNFRRRCLIAVFFGGELFRRIKNHIPIGLACCKKPGGLGMGKHF